MAADDIPVRPSADQTAESVAVDRISGRGYQVVKNAWGADANTVAYVGTARGSRFPTESDVRKSSAIHALGRATVDTSVDLIVAAYTDRLCVTMKNTGTVTVYLGGATVTASDGYPLDPGETVEDRDGTHAWYGITASGSAVVAYLEE